MISAQSVKPLYLLLIAVGMVATLFFDVLFLQATLQPSNIVPRITKPADWSVRSILPLMTRKVLPGTGYADLGASAWQSEPARYLMARNFRTKESPFWNPYSAAGTLGPETLVDIKFSPFTLISAYFFNASSESFDYGLLIIYALGAFFVLLILNHSLQLSLLASVAGAIVYLLNGFALPNLNSHMGQPYFFFPLLLYSMLGFSEKQTCHRFVWLVLAYTPLLLITFLPTVLLVLFTLHVITIAWFLQTKRSTKDLAIYIYLSGIALLTAFLLVAPLWFPIIDSFSVSNMLTSYQSRSLQLPRDISNLLSVFTPKHFWQNYSGMFPSTLYPNAGLERNVELIAHAGIFTALIASYAFSGKPSKTNILIPACVVLFLFSYARIFGFVPFINSIPIIRSISMQYWGCMSSIALIILTAYGCQNILIRKTNCIPAVMVMVILAAAFLNLLFLLGFTDIPPYHRYLKIVIYTFFMACGLIWIIRTSTDNRGMLAILLGGLMLIELVFYMNTLRPIRYNPIDEQPTFVEFIKNNVDQERILNIGLNKTLYPEFGSMYGIKQLGTQNPGLLPWYETFYKRHIGSDSWQFLTLGYAAEIEKTIVNSQVLTPLALDIANVKYILVVDNAKPYLDFLHERNYPLVFQKDGLNIFENPHPLTIATLVPTILHEQLLPETSVFNPRQMVVSDDALLIKQAQELGIPVLDSGGSSNSLATGTATLLSYHNTEILLETESTQPAILAISEVWHPNWKATLNEQAVYIGRINEAFRGIALPPGKHRIRLVYDSAALRYGCYVSVTMLLILLSLIAIGFYAFPKRRA